MKSMSTFSAEKFYDITSEFYEQMIAFDKNLDLRIEAYENIFPQKGIAADLGCGIGLDSIALAKNGHKVTAFDISPRMIEAAKINSIKYDTRINFQVKSIFSIPKVFNQKFDFIVCVGNTIAHMNESQLQKTLNRIYGLLMPQGKVFLHILNYNAIIKSNKRINNIAHKDGKIIIRFYDFLENFIRFNILFFDETAVKNHSLISTKHYPHSRNSIINFLKEEGFGKIKCYGDFYRQSFDPTRSKDLFIEAIK